MKGNRLFPQNILFIGNNEVERYGDMVCSFGDDVPRDLLRACSSSRRQRKLTAKCRVVNYIRNAINANRWEFMCDNAFSNCWRQWQRIHGFVAFVMRKIRFASHSFPRKLVVAALAESHCTLDASSSSTMWLDWIYCVRGISFLRFVNACKFDSRWKRERESETVQRHNKKRKGTTVNHSVANR